MNDFTEQEFNEAMARLDNRHQAYFDYCEFKGFKPNIEDDFYNDLNQLMPIAWKYDVFRNENVINSELCPASSYEDWLHAIRQCLWQIYKEQT